MVSFYAKFQMPRNLCVGSQSTIRPLQENSLFPISRLHADLFPRGHSLVLPTKHFIHYLFCDCIAVTSLAFRKPI